MTRCRGPWSDTRSTTTSHRFSSRWVAIVGARMGPVMVEGGLFNGDEPGTPGLMAPGGRFADSWWPALGPTRQGARGGRAPTPRCTLPSTARARNRQHKQSLSARWDDKAGSLPVYGLVEWSRTSEADGFFIFHGLLAEGAWTRGRTRLHYRFERTERPEEERTLNPFRSIRPHLEIPFWGRPDGPFIPRDTPFGPAAPLRDLKLCLFWRFPAGGRLMSAEGSSTCKIFTGNPPFGLSVLASVSALGCRCTGWAATG